MRQLLPEPVDHVEPYDVYRPADPSARLLRLNMIVSLDGRVADATGRSGSLGGPADRSVFRALRALADAILVGAGTVRVEGYGPHRLPPALADRRAADGRPDPAPVVVVTRSLRLDLASRLFTEAVTRTVLLTCSGAPRDRLAEARRVTDVVVCGSDQVDLAAGLEELAGRGLLHVLCEGGPALNRPLLEAGLVDELCLTVAPTLVGGYGPPIVRRLGTRTDLELASLCEEDGALFARYAASARRPDELPRSPFR